MEWLREKESCVGKSWRRYREVSIVRGYWGNWDWVGRGFGCFGEIWGGGGGLGIVFDGDFRVGHGGY